MKRDSDDESTMDDADISRHHADVPVFKSSADKIALAADNFSSLIDCSTIPLKSDHANRPLWIAPDGVIYLEAFSPLVEQAQDFLVAIAEPISRPSFIHEYRLTAYSLYAAVSIGLETDDIIDVLNRLSKTSLPQNIVDFVRNNTVSFGKLKLVLKQNKFFIESSYPDTLQLILKDSVIKNCIQHSPLSKTINEEIGDDKMDLDYPKEKETDIYNTVIDIEQEEVYANEYEESDRLYSFQIRSSEVETVKRRCNEIDYPLIEEYDFHRDETIPSLDVDLKPSTVIRPYQEKCLSKMFGNGRARSGIIVLPCGAGKTLVGITAACTIKKSTLVLCTSAVSVEQWRSQFKFFSNISDDKIARFTSDKKETFLGNAGIVVSTYTMVAYSGKRSYEAQKMMDFITSMEWGFLLLDEVHVVPANVFRKVLIAVAAHTKLGLTATLVREDEKITDLNFLIGPKLYEANWLDLAKKGHIANVQCAEVWCPMTAEFYSEYLKANSRKRKLLYVMNPNKFRACQFLMEYHEKRGDKIIIFSDDVYALKKYAEVLNRLFIYGATGSQERMRILQNFQYNPAVNTIFLSKVGDTSIDLPEATCLIQISSHYGSRRQEAQRLGRILRAKRRNDEGFNAFFYSLVSQDTQEMYYSSKRQQFLIDQGYAFKVITNLPPSNIDPGDPNAIDLSRLVLGTRTEQIKLLNDVLLASEADLKDEEVLVTDDISSLITKRATKINMNMKSISGADEMAYVEYEKDSSQKGPVTGGSKLFKKFRSGLK